MDPLRVIIIFICILCGIAYGIGVTLKQVVRSNFFGEKEKSSESCHVERSIKILEIDNEHRILYF